MNVRDYQIESNKILEEIKEEGNGNGKMDKDRGGGIREREEDGC